MAKDEFQTYSGEYRALLDALGLDMTRLDRRTRAAIEALCEEVVSLRNEAGGLREALADSELLADNDTLCPVFNRRAFEREVRREIALSGRFQTPLSLIFIDLDNFKLVNDTLGHDAGDRLLVEAAARIRGAVRATDHVARLGGDEFTVVLEQVDDRETVGQIAANILSALSAPYAWLGGTAGRVSASIGASLYPDDAASPESLLKNADIAMYASKTAGKARFAEYDARMAQALLARIDAGAPTAPAGAA